MEYKHVPVSAVLTMPVPLGLSPEEEAKFIAGRLAFVNLDELEADCRSVLKLWEEGKTIPLEDVLAELASDPANGDGKTE